MIYLSSVMSTVSLWTVLIPFSIVAGGLELRLRQHWSIRSSFFCKMNFRVSWQFISHRIHCLTWPSEQSSSKARLKLLRTLPLVVTHLVLAGRSRSQVRATWHLSRTSSRLSRSGSRDSWLLLRPSSSTRTVVGTLICQSPDSASSLISARLSTRMFVSGTRVFGLRWILSLANHSKLVLHIFIPQSN